MRKVKTAMEKKFSWDIGDSVEKFCDYFAWETIECYLDVDICNDLSETVCPCELEVFLSHYLEAHEEKFKEIFIIN